MIQNGGQGQNSNPLRVPVTPIQIHTSILPPLCLHNWLQAFGIHHISWNPICKQRTAAVEKQASLFLTRRCCPYTQSLEAGPQGDVLSVLPNAKLSRVWGEPMLRVLKYTSKFHWGEICGAESVWKDDEDGTLHGILFWWDPSETKRKAVKSW